MAPVRLAASASSIFKTGNLGECVSGRSLAGADFHGHSLSVKSRQASLRCLGERRIRRRTGRVRFIPHRQSSLPGRPTYRDHSFRECAGSFEVTPHVVSIYSLRISAGRGAPRAASQWLYRVQLGRIGRRLAAPSFLHDSYPEGHFRGNQLPQVSIGLSPLCPSNSSVICTSTRMRTSSRVSPAFILVRHRSTSFGCHRLCFYSNHI